MKRALRICSTGQKLFTGSDPQYEKAVNVIRIQSKQEDPNGRRPQFDAIANGLYGKAMDDEARREILRIGVLLANVHALAETRRGTFERPSVYRRLGFDSDGNQYRALFARRGRRMERNGKVIVSSTHLRVEPLQPLNPGAEGNEDLFLNWVQSALDPMDKLRIRHYLESCDEGYDLEQILPYLED